MELSWIAKNWGNIASALGLIIGLWVLAISKGARQAALEARESVRRQSLSQELKSTSDDLSFLNLLCDGQNWETAAYLASRVMRDLSFIRTRWSKNIDDSSLQQLSLIQSTLETVNSQLRKFKRVGVSERELSRLESSINEMNTRLTEILGKYISKLDGIESK